jgi:arginine decarboxylase
MLDYVGYDLKKLRAAYQAKIDAAKLPADTARELAAALEKGLTGYTYLDASTLA